MWIYQGSVCFYICDLNLEVIEKFQANNYRHHTGKRLYHLPREISGNSPRNFWSNGKRPGVTYRREIYDRIDLMLYVCLAVFYACGCDINLRPTSLKDTREGEKLHHWKGISSNLYTSHRFNLAKNHFSRQTVQFVYHNNLLLSSWRSLTRHLTNMFSILLLF